MDKIRPINTLTISVLPVKVAQITIINSYVLKNTQINIS